jgi:hypothetical protein
MRKNSSVCLLVALTVGLVLLSASNAAAQKKVTDLEGVQFNTGASLSDNMKAFAGKDVYIHLRSGKTFQGYVKAVGNGLLHMEKLAGREFYDALIRFEDISAIEVKFRDMK